MPNYQIKSEISRWKMYAKSLINVAIWVKTKFLANLCWNNFYTSISNFSAEGLLVPGR